MSRDVNMTAAFEEGIKARESHYSKYSNPYLVSHLRAAWNRGWDSGEPIPGQDQAQTEDTHGHTWDLAESLGELVRSEVAKEVGGRLEAHASSLTSMHGNIGTILDIIQGLHNQVYTLKNRASDDQRIGKILGRELGPAWMKRIEALEARVANGEVQAIDHVAQERIDANREWLESIEGRTYSRIRNLQQSSIDTKQELATINQRIADVETTLERLEGDDCEYVPGEVSKALESIGDALDDYSPPAAGPWKEGTPPDNDINKWLVRWDEDVYLWEDIRAENVRHITDYARIHLPETTDD